MEVQTYEQASREDFIAHTEQIHKLQEQNAALTNRLGVLEASLDKYIELLERIPNIVTKQERRLDILSDTLHLHIQSTHNKEAAAIMEGRSALDERVTELEASAPPT